LVLLGRGKIGMIGNDAHIRRENGPFTRKSGRLPVQGRKGNHIVYIGKAGNIRKRVSSYFQRLTEKDAKTLLMLEKVKDQNIPCFLVGKRI
jgi:hypothetical protein